MVQVYEPGQLTSSKFNSYQGQIEKVIVYKTEAEVF
jgi:hypothetical protein